MPAAALPGFADADLAHLMAKLADVGQRELLPRFMHLAPADVAEKTSSFDLVTEADRAAERAILDALQARHPHAQCVGEESCTLATAAQALQHADLVFVVDPLDGTRNFVAGVPVFGVMVAVVVRGTVVAGVIHDPVTGSTAWARRGLGAQLADRSGRSTPLRCARPRPLLQMEGIAGINFLPEPLRSRVGAHLPRVGISNWFRCAAHEYRMAAAGHLDYLFYNKLMPWDHAAGWLLHQESGGYSAHFDGTAYAPWHFQGGLLCAPDQATWQAIHSALF